MSLPSLPSDENSLYQWIAVLTVGYLIVAYCIQWRADRKLFADQSQRKLISKIFDSATFAGSVMLFLGVMDKNVLNAIGSTKPFLLFAGLAGVIYSLHALKPPDDAP